MVRFDVPVEVAFDYLADPHNRPQWQPSLRRVEVAEGPVAIGLRWVDVTWPGLRPQMEITACERPSYWEERGHWRAGPLRIDVRIWLRFTSLPTGCAVQLGGTGVPRPMLSLGRSDLRGAARILEGR